MVSGRWTFASIPSLRYFRILRGAGGVWATVLCQLKTTSITPWELHCSISKPYIPCVKGILGRSFHEKSKIRYLDHFWPLLLPLIQTQKLLKTKSFLDMFNATIVLWEWGGWFISWLLEGIQEMEWFSQEWTSAPIDPGNKLAIREHCVVNWWGLSCNVMGS